MRKWMFVLLLTSLNVLGQVNGKVVNAQHLPVPLTNIWVLDGSDGATTDSLGMFSIPTALPQDTLVFNASGYELLKEEASKAETIILQSYEIPQPALIVYPEKSLHHTIGNAHFENLYFQPGNVPYMYGRYFENNSEIQAVQYIDKIVVYTKSAVAAATIKIRLLRMNEYGCPSNDLLTEPILAEVKRGTKKNLIQVLKHNVKIPKNGVFVAVEWLMTENNQFKPMNFLKEEQMIQDFRYMPDVMNNKVEKAASFRYMAGEWFPNDQFQSRIPNAPKEIVDPAIGLILSN